jgi:hypothetical protein
LESVKGCWRNQSAITLVLPRLDEDLGVYLPWLQSGRTQYEEIKIKAPSAAPPSALSFYMSNVNNNTGFRHTTPMVPPLVFPINTLVVEGRWQGGRVIIPDAGGWRSFSRVRVESKIASLNDNRMDVV